MATNDDIRLAKGVFNITLFTTNDTENLKNNLQKIPPIQPAGKQELGPKETKVVDLLRITETFVFGCVITKSGSTSAKTVKKNLQSLAKGAGVNGGTPATLYYEDETFSVYVEDLVIKKVKNDNAVENYSGDDAAEYMVTITLVKGEEVS